MEEARLSGELVPKSGTELLKFLKNWIIIEDPQEQVKAKKALQSIQVLATHTIVELETIYWWAKFKVWGCDAYALIEKEARVHLAPGRVAVKGVFVDLDRGAWVIWAEGREWITQHCQFLETYLLSVGIASSMIMINACTQTDQPQVQQQGKQPSNVFMRGLGMGRAATRSSHTDHVSLAADQLYECKPQVGTSVVTTSDGKASILSATEPICMIDDGEHVTEVELEAMEGWEFVDEMQVQQRVEVKDEVQTMTGAGGVEVKDEVQTMTGAGDAVQTFTGAGMDVQTSTDVGDDQSTDVRGVFVMKPIPTITLQGPQGRYEIPNPSTVEQAMRTPQAAKWDGVIRGHISTVERADARGREDTPISTHVTYQS
eukprot:5200357-Prymnesium_polylepis.1